MTRRKFIQRLIRAGAAVIIGVVWMAKKTVPKRFVRAVRLKKYPGPLKALGNISKESKWRG